MRGKQRRRRLLRVLKELASSSKGVLAWSTLMRRAGYGKRGEFVKDLEYLQSLGVVEPYRSGFPSDSRAHHKVVVLTADVISVDVKEELEFEDEEETELQPIPKYDDTFQKLTMIQTPLGDVSYMKSKAFNKLTKEEREFLTKGVEAMKKMTLKKRCLGFAKWYISECKRQRIPCDCVAYDLPDAWADWLESLRTGGPRFREAAKQ